MAKKEARRAIHILGIETSCDDCGVAVLRWDHGKKPTILSSLILDQAKEHSPFGGVVPEIAARQHAKSIGIALVRALFQSGLQWNNIDAVAVTSGPGLIGSLNVGLAAAKGLHLGLKVPFVAINHLEGHVLSPRIGDQIPFPYLALLVSGGHTQLVCVHDYGRYQRLGTTIDDSAGEALDKTAKILGLPMPGGPHLEKLAKGGRDDVLDLPLPMKKHPGLDFSFSGLKTAIVQQIRAAKIQGESLRKQDIAATAQRAIFDHILDRSEKALRFISQQGLSTFVLVGGVSANSLLRQRFTDLCASYNFTFHAPDPDYCTDNAAMIAWALYERLRAKRQWPEVIHGAPLELSARARWPLDEMPEGVRYGSGKKGYKV